MKFDNQLRYAVNIINSYDGTVPLAAWLKDYYRSNKQMGSTDRKTVSQMVYGYYRTGFSQYNAIEEKILAGLKAAGQLPMSWSILYRKITAFLKPPYQLFFHGTNI